MSTATRTLERPAPPMPPPAPGTGLSVRPAQPQQPVQPQRSPQPERPAQADQATATPVADRLRSTLLRGAIFGPVAIGAAMLLAMWASASAGDQALRPLRLLTVLTQGGGGLVAGSPLLGVAINVVLGAVLGVLFAVAATRIGSPRDLLLGGLFFGAAVFAVDLYLLSPLLSDVLTLRDAPFELALRLIFGAILALGFMPTRAPR